MKELILIAQDHSYLLSLVLTSFITQTLHRSPTFFTALLHSNTVLPHLSQNLLNNFSEFFYMCFMSNHICVVHVVLVQFMWSLSILHLLFYRAAKNILLSPLHLSLLSPKPSALQPNCHLCTLSLLTKSWIHQIYQHNWATEMTATRWRFGVLKKLPFPLLP